MFAIGALIAERYGLPGPVTNLTDRGFDQIAILIDKTPLARTETNDTPTPDAASAMAIASPHAAAPAFRGDLDSNQGLTVNDSGLDIIKTSRGLRLSAAQSGAGWQVGYGHTATANEGMTITVPRAEELLRDDLAKTEAGLREVIGVPLSRNEFSALVSFTASIGGVEALQQTDVLDQLNRGNREAAAAAMLEHTMVQRGNELIQMPSLVERRERERQLFLRESDIDE